MDNYSKYLVESSVGAIGRFVEVDSYYTNVNVRKEAAAPAAEVVEESAADSYYAELLDMLINEDYIETAEDLADLYEAAADAMKRYFEMGPGNASKDLPKGAGKNSAFRDLVFGKDAFDKLDKMQRNGLFGAK